MSLRWLLDTDIVITVLRGAPPPLRRRLSQQAGHIAVSSISGGELYYGAHRSADVLGNVAAIQGFLPFVTRLALDDTAAEHAGEIRADLAAAGTPIGGHDLLIAGTARSRGLTVVTNDRREFDRVAGLLVADWTSD